MDGNQEIFDKIMENSEFKEDSHAYTPSAKEEVLLDSKT